MLSLSLFMEIVCACVCKFYVNSYCAKMCVCVCARASKQNEDKYSFAHVLER